MRFRVVSRPDASHPLGQSTRVLNAETGEPVENVVAVAFEHRVDEVPLIRIEVADPAPPSYDVEAEGVIGPPRPAGPRLMIVSERRLSCDATVNILRGFEHANRSGKSLVIDGGMKVYQLVDGRWQPLDPSDPAEPGGFAVGQAEWPPRAFGQATP